MDIDETRRTNIKALEQIAGSATAVASKMDMSYSQYVNLRDGARDPRSGKKRAMRKETAWRFEDAFGMPRGWLDTPHPEPGADLCVAEAPALAYTVRPPHARKLVQTVCELAEQINDNGLRELIGFARCLTGTHPAAKQTPASSA